MSTVTAVGKTYGHIYWFRVSRSPCHRHKGFAQPVLMAGKAGTIVASVAGMIDARNDSRRNIARLPVTKSARVFIDL